VPVAAVPAAAAVEVSTTAAAQVPKPSPEVAGTIATPLVHPLMQWVAGATTAASGVPAAP